METKGTIRLDNPIMVDGLKHHELSYDFDAITPDMFMEADITAAGKALQMKKPTVTAPELDASFHLQLGIQAVIAANPTWDATDVGRVRGRDVYRVMAVGRDFMTAAVEEDEDADTDAAAGQSADGDEKAGQE